MYFCQLKLEQRQAEKVLHWKSTYQDNPPPTYTHKSNKGKRKDWRKKKREGGRERRGRRGARGRKEWDKGITEA